MRLTPPSNTPLESSEPPLLSKGGEVRSETIWKPGSEAGNDVKQSKAYGACGSRPKGPGSPRTVAVRSCAKDPLRERRAAGPRNISGAQYHAGHNQAEEGRPSARQTQREHPSSCKLRSEPADFCQSDTRNGRRITMRQITHRTANSKYNRTILKAKTQTN